MDGSKRSLSVAVTNPSVVGFDLSSFFFKVDSTSCVAFQNKLSKQPKESEISLEADTTKRMQRRTLKLQTRLIL
jgi:hypothetical protein